MFLNKEQYNRIVGVLMPYMGDTETARRARVQSALHDSVVLDHITYDGANYEFTHALIGAVNKHCDPPDLIALIEAVKATVGDTKAAAFFDPLVDELRPKPVTPDDQPEAAPTALEQSTYVRSADAVLVKRPRRDLDLPDRDVGLVGRGELQTRIRGALDACTNVLVHGFSGRGKTALASQVAADWYADGKGMVLAVRAGDADPAPLLEAVGNAFGAGKAVASAPDLNTKTDIVYDLLEKRREVTLVLVDDAWNGAALRVLLDDALPDDVPALVTARQRYPVAGEMIPLDDVDDAAALDMLRRYAGADVDAGDGTALCRKLGNLAFGLRVVGRTMKAQGRSARTMLDKLDAPHAIKIPLDFSTAGRESLAVLIEQSLDTLPGDARDVFMALGAFFAPTITAELMALYLPGDADAPTDTDDPNSSVGATQHANAIAKTDDILTQLVQAGLMTRIPPTDTAIAHYRTHDLGHAYAAAHADDSAKRRAVRACIAYTWNYNEPSLPNFAALTPELDNFEGASAWAFAAGMDDAVEDFAWNLYFFSKVLDYRGLYTRAVPLLERAAACAERAGNRYNQGAHLGNLALAHRSLGQVQRAIRIYEKIVVIFREIDDKRAVGITLGNLGVAYDSLGQYEQAIDYYKQALAISRDIGDRRNEGNWLGNLGNAYRNLGQYEQAIDTYQQALAISREIGDRVGESNDLNNLGTAYEDLEQYARALDYYQQALAIFQALNLPHLIEHVERNIARVRGKMSGA